MTHATVGRFRDRKTGELIEPFGYALDASGRPIREAIDTSKPPVKGPKLTVCYLCGGPLDEAEHCAKCNPPELCVACDGPLNAVGDCENCAGARQGNV